MSIDAYVPGRAASPGQAALHKLSSNENPLGPSIDAVEAVRSNASAIALYPEGSAAKLREAIGASHSIDPARIVCGTGSNELLYLCAQAYLSPGEEGIHTQYGFLVFRNAILGGGGRAVAVPETDLRVDVDEILKAITPKTRLIYVANPGNPTGSHLPGSELERLVSSVPGNVLIIIDEAYGEYVDAEDFISALAVAGPRENVVVTRTFSKIYGLAGLRLGWCYAPSRVCDAFHRLRNPFNVSSIAVEAGCAALADKEHTEHSWRHNKHWRARLAGELGTLGLIVHPSQTNFLLLDFSAIEGRSAAEANRFLLENGLLLRSTAAYGLTESLRLTIGTDEANRHLVETLTRFMTGGAGSRGVDRRPGQD